MKISIVLPIYNEEENIPILFDELLQVLPKISIFFEIIAVNDGSKDGTQKVLQSIASKDNRFKVISFKFNSGQTAALAAGLAHATGDIIIPMDSDLQNDPADIPRLIEKMEEGYDVVSGWRQGRWKGQFFTRRLPSSLANWLISRSTGVKLHDIGCIMKLYKRDVIEDATLYGEMHRFMPIYAAWTGARIAELPVNDRERKYGKSNYGFSRIVKVPLDLLVVYFMGKFLKKPIHFFGALGFVSLFIGGVAGISAIAMRLTDYKDLVETPLPIFSALFIIIGVQLILMGLLAELVMRTYYESQQKFPYIIKEKINL